MKDSLIKLGLLGSNISFDENNSFYKVTLSKDGESFFIKKDKNYSLMLFNNSLYLKSFSKNSTLFFNKVLFYKNLLKGFISGYSSRLIITGVGYRFIKLNDVSERVSVL